MRILFQGDSITDGCRDRSDPTHIGWGYAKFASEAIALRHPETKFEFINRGIGGNKSEDLVNRWQEDCIDLNPDFVSILIGINDTWHNADNKTWIDNKVFEANCRYLLEEIKTKTDAKIMLLEPFLIYTEDKAFFREDLDFKIDVIRNLAREYADAFIPLDGPFAAACVGVDPLCWSEDGVHPNDAGSAFIGKRYADAFDLIYQTMKK